MGFTRAHAEIPVFAISAYLFTIFYVRDQIKDWKPLPFKALFASWNLLLSVFSLLGASRLVPCLIRHLQQHGFQYTCCMEPQSWYLDGAEGFWITLFIYSKIPE